MNHSDEGIQTLTFDDAETDTSFNIFRQSQITQTEIHQSETATADNPSILIGTPREKLREALENTNISLIENVCHSLQLNISTPIDSIVNFADSLNETKYNFLLRLLSPVDYFPPPVQIPQTLTPEMIRKFDLGFRFEVDDFESTIIAGPYFIGAVPFSQSVRIEYPIGSKKRIIVQSISQSGISFPQSLILCSGQNLLISENFDTNCSKIDITPVVCGSSIIIDVQAQKEQQWFCLLFRLVTKLSYDKLIKNVFERKLPSAYQQSAVCPATGKIMKIPVRSLKCQHIQCFELKAALKRAKNDDKIICPICRSQVFFSDLAVNVELVQALTSMRVNKAMCELTRLR